MSGASASEHIETIPMRANDDHDAHQRLKDSIYESAKQWRKERIRISMVTYSPDTALLLKLAADRAFLETVDDILHREDQ